MLEESDRIDLAVTTANGGVALIITDAGLTADPSQRIALLVEKLRTYIKYICSDEFTSDHPGKVPSDVVICVMCATAPTPEMRQMIRISLPNDPSRAITVEFREFPRP
jgi:hypothetical protein